MLEKIFIFLKSNFTDNSIFTSLFHSYNSNVNSGTNTNFQNKPKYQKLVFARERTNKKY